LLLVELTRIIDADRGGGSSLKRVVAGHGATTLVRRYRVFNPKFCGPG